MIKRLPVSHPAYHRGVSEYGTISVPLYLTARILCNRKNCKGIIFRRACREMEIQTKYGFRIISIISYFKDPSRYLVQVNLDGADGVDFQIDIDAETCGNEMRFINSVSSGIYRVVVVHE